MRLWEVSTGRCLRSFEGHTDWVTSVSLSADGRYALSGGLDGTLRLWELDWELEAHDPTDWDEAARPFLEIFLTQHTPYAGILPTDREPSEEEIQQALTRSGRATWIEEDFQGLIRQLQYAGLGWLRPEGVRRKLEEMTQARPLTVSENHEKSNKLSTPLEKTKWNRQPQNPSRTHRKSPGFFGLFRLKD
jgi:hypothetical protein